MSPTYTSLEDGQVIKTKEPRPDLDELARWKRSDVDDEPESTGVVPPSPQPVAGPVNTDPVTGGNPPLTSASAGIANPADTLTTEQARERAAEQLQGGVVPPLQQQVGRPGADNPTGEPDPSDPVDVIERPGLNVSTEDWTAFAKRADIDLDLNDDAGRDELVAAYIDKFAPAGNASAEKWADYAKEHGVKYPEGAGHDAIRAAVAAAGWAKD